MIYDFHILIFKITNQIAINNRITHAYSISWTAITWAWKSVLYQNLAIFEEFLLFMLHFMYKTDFW